MSWKIQYINSSGKQQGGTRKDSKQKEFYAKAASVSYGKTLADRKKKAKALGFKIDENLSNDDISVMVNDKNKEVIYSIAGTRLSQPKHRWRDLGEDALLTLGLQKFGYRKGDVEKVINKAQDKYKGFEPTISAHSLGGSVGRRISKDTGISAVLYNIGSSPLSVLSDKVNDILNKSKKADVLKHYSVKSDPLSVSERVLGDVDVADVKKKENLNPHTLKQFQQEGSGKKNKWLVHVAKVRAKNKGMKYSEVLKLASTSYRR